MNKRRRYKAKRLRLARKKYSDAQGTLNGQRNWLKLKMHATNYGMSAETLKALREGSWTT